MTSQASRMTWRGSVYRPGTLNRRAVGSARYFSTRSLRGGEPGCCISQGASARRVSAARDPPRSAECSTDPRRVQALRRELADAERALRAQTRREAGRMALAERAALREALEDCYAYDRIRHNASARLDAIRAGSPERFRNERQLAEMAIRKADRADAAYTIIAFAKRHDRFRYLQGGAEREAAIDEAITRGGVYTEGRGGQHFKEILR